MILPIIYLIYFLKFFFLTCFQVSPSLEIQTRPNSRSANTSRYISQSPSHLLQPSLSNKICYENLFHSLHNAESRHLRPCDPIPAGDFTKNNRCRHLAKVPPPRIATPIVRQSTRSTTSRIGSITMAAGWLSSPASSPRCASEGGPPRSTVLSPAGSFIPIQGVGFNFNDQFSSHLNSDVCIFTNFAFSVILKF